VEVLTQCSTRDLPELAVHGGVTWRRFPNVITPPRFAVASGLWEYLRATARSFDLADLHTNHAPFALAASRADFRRLVFSPHAPIQRLLRWPFLRATRSVIHDAAHVVCESQAARDLLADRFPADAHRMEVSPGGVDETAIRAARPFEASSRVLLSIGRLERHERIERAIASLASLDPSFRLIVIGDGPGRHRLDAYAADLRVASRMAFTGALPTPNLYRWLRTATVFVALAEHEDSGQQVAEALTAGAPVVASDIPAHREAASYVDADGVIFVSPEGSPLEVADAIADAARLRLHSVAHASAFGWDAVVDRTLGLYERLVLGGRAAAEDRGPAAAELPTRAADDTYELRVPD
jgi:glycosyltransferase involved in cell wall biosynthesis